MSRGPGIRSGPVLQPRWRFRLADSHHDPGAHAYFVDKGAHFIAIDDSCYRDTDSCRPLGDALAGAEEPRYAS
jgi:hypothetical protein